MVVSIFFSGTLSFCLGLCFVILQGYIIGFWELKYILLDLVKSTLYFYEIVVIPMLISTISFKKSLKNNTHFLVYFFTCFSFAGIVVLFALNFYFEYVISYLVITFIHLLIVPLLKAKFPQKQYQGK